jgi:hypothetical protein
VFWDNFAMFLRDTIRPEFHAKFDHFVSDFCFNCLRIIHFVFPLCFDRVTRDYGWSLIGPVTGASITPYAPALRSKGIPSYLDNVNIVFQISWGERQRPC